MALEIQGFVGVNENTNTATVNGSVQVASGEDFPGLIIGGETDVQRITAGAVTDTSQAIRMRITVDDQDVTDSLAGTIQISHNLNYISSFRFALVNPDHSPLVDTHIDIDSVVIITTYVNGIEIKMFTGLVDKTESHNSSAGYLLIIYGRDYGKKLLNTTKTLISVNEKAGGRRGNIVRFLAGQAGVTDTQIPTGDSVGIDHSFQDQTIWDMIQKECAIEGWYVRFDENGKMICKTRDISANAHWTYGENKFTEIGLQTLDDGIINKVTILGAIFEDVNITVETTEGTPGQVIINPTTYDYSAYVYQKSFSAGESVTAWSAQDSNFKITTAYVTHSTPYGYFFPTAQVYRFTITRLNSALTVANVDYTISGNANLRDSNNNYCEVNRLVSGTTPPLTFSEAAFSISINIKTKERISGGKEEIEGTAPSETIVETVIHEQVKASVSDHNSIAAYGERKPNNEGTLNYPLAETAAQCRRIGNNIIRDSHRFIEQPDLMVMLNPKLIVGQKVNLTDKKIGYDDDDYFIEEVVHYIDIDKEGKLKGRTRIGGVWYA